MSISEASVVNPGEFDSIDQNHIASGVADRGDSDLARQQPNTLVIGIPTFRRPKSLRRLLDSLANLTTHVQPIVVVADNDAQGQEGVRVVESIEQDYRWPIEAIVVGQRGISQARNAIMKAGFARPGTSAIVMIDDDQWVQPNWLDEMLAMQEHTNADVVGNMVVPEFNRRVPSWANGLQVFGIPNQPDGMCDVIDGTCGVLLMRSVEKYSRDLYFDPSFSLTGGGDSEFFARLKNQGASFAFASRAVAYEVVDASRLTRRWALRRAFRIGGGFMRITMMHSRSRLHCCAEIAKALLVILVAPLMTIFYCLNPRRSMRAAVLLFRNLGKLSALCKFQVQEYKTTVGD